MTVAPVSVIIPCYCCSNVLERAVRSVMTQTFAPLEIILVDDASPDDQATRNCILSIKEIYHQNTNIHIHSIFLKFNHGPSGARNAGWDIAKGEYIAFLDADDAWSAEKIEIQYTWMVQNPMYDLSGHQFVLFSKYTQCSVNNNNNFSIKNLTFQQTLIRNLTPTPTVMLKRNLTYRFDENIHFAEDYDLWLRIMSEGHKTALIQRVLAFCFRPNSTPGGQSGNLWKMERAELQIYLRLYSNKKIGLLMLISVSAFSFVKYLKRIFMNNIFYKLAS